MLFNFEGPKGTSKEYGGVPEAMQTCGGVAQLGEHLPCKQGVDSSILFISTSCPGGTSHTLYDVFRGKTC